MAAALAVAVGATGVAGLQHLEPVSAAPPAVSHSSVVNPNPIDNTPHVLDGRTEAVLDLGSRVIVGGTFTQVKNFNRPEVFDRPYLFAYDKATGAVDTAFAPAPNGRVSALLVAADGSILVSGQFRTIGGRNAPFLAKLDPATGAARTNFTPTPNGMVYDMHQARGHLYIGGTFNRIGTTVRTNFAILDANTGAIRPGADIAFTGAPRGTTRVMRLDVSPDGTRLVAIGNFLTVGGQVRDNVGVLDLTAGGSATVSGWRTDAYRDRVCGTSWDTVTYDVDIAPAGGWFVIVTTGGARGALLCDTATRWELGGNSPANPTWSNWTGGDSLTSVAITGAAVYVAGHNRWLNNPQGVDSAGPGAVERPGIGALSPTTGQALAWNPGRERGFVAPRLVATTHGLYVLSDSSRFFGEWHPRLTYLTLTGQITLPTTTTTTTSTTTTTTRPTTTTSTTRPVTPTTSTTTTRPVTPTTSSTTTRPVTPTPPSTTQPPNGQAPSAPGRVSVTAATATSATLSWGAPASTGGSAIVEYRVTARVGNTVVGTRAAGTARSVTWVGLPNARALTFTVTARNASREGASSAASLPAVLPFTTVEAFTRQQFRDVLGRGVTSAEMADWNNRVGGNRVLPAAAVDELIGHSSSGRVARGASIIRLYRAYFLRYPDGGGFQYWNEKVRTGTSVEAASQSFATSAEFRSRYGKLDDRAFVQLVYRNVLGRQADATGLEYWVGRLRSGMTRGRVMTSFSESSENVRASQHQVTAALLSHLLLDRAPTAYDRDTMAARLQAGEPRVDLIAEIFASGSYERRVR